VSSSNQQKYESGNPVVQRLLGRFLDRVVGLAAAQAPRTVVDLGCGEGLVAERVLAQVPGVEYRGIELSAEAAAEARRNAPAASVRVGDIRRVAAEPGWADVSLCLEVLEHLDDPRPALRRIAEWTGGLALISVPWEPFFRGGNLLRGKYLDRLGNHPEHVQHFGPRSLKRLLETEFAVVEIETCFPWLIARAAAPRTH
jgi:SAM-dependent methyltransferase